MAMSNNNITFSELFEKLPDNHTISIFEESCTSIFKKSHALTSHRHLEFCEWFEEMEDQVETFFYHLNSKDSGELRIYLNGCNRKIPY